jgi:hypothetical protein
MKATVKNPKKTDEHLNGVLTYRQIRNRVGDGWAVIQDPEFNGAILLKGKLVFHSSDRAEALDELFERKGDLLFKYCGKVDPNVVYLL